jgi:saccharopine dehydrogenase (NADP+, L-glutamate forming)
MRKILILGAGRSASTLIRYLIDHSQEGNWKVIVADISEELAKQKTGDHPNASALSLNISDEEMLGRHVNACDLVISLLPPSLHILAAKTCLKHKKDLITASYLSDEIKALDADVRKEGLIFLNECGLDPGIDHMSAKEIIDRIHDEGGKVLSFRSYTGGLIAPESSDNPWGYKFTWNPRNVILAGQSTATFLHEGKNRYVPYHRLFLETEEIRIDDAHIYDGYANRDSLGYMEVYGLRDTKTLIRGTLRNRGFCSAWSVFVKLGLTDDNVIINPNGDTTYADLVRSFLPGKYDEKSLRSSVAALCGIDEGSTPLDLVEWTGIFSDNPIQINGETTPARILQQLLESKWQLKEDDIDMIVMCHEFIHEHNGVKKRTNSSLTVKGDDAVHTAMSKTVGLPAAIAARLILEDKIKLTGALIPVDREIYEPVLKELDAMGITFNENEERL